MGKICFLTDIAFWKIAFHRYVKARTQLSTTKWFLGKKKTVFKKIVLQATVRGSQGWQSWVEHGWLVSSLHFCTSANTSHEGAWCTAETRAGRQEDAHVLGNLLVNPHLLRPYLYTPKINPKAHPKPIPKPGRVRYDISEDTVGQQGARLFRRK